MDNQIAQGIELAVFGMGTVFLFLGLLVLATLSMSNLILRFYTEPKVTTTRKATHSGVVAVNPRMIAVISAAISQHRAANKNS